MKTTITIEVVINHPDNTPPEEVKDIAVESLERGILIFESLQVVTVTAEIK